ncbi:MAG: RHS repeat-associated core domain-containing protein, partial [Defluviitaleaceae bacterium]|nr:RHS repeat-associated core domain-containing protein [Defluviitaleaceae bacterium]
TELYYNRHRYYDPQLGQYITQDPIGLAGNNPTLYGYVSNPNVWIDPFGLRCRPSNPNRMQQEVQRGQAPRGIDRVDRPHVPGQEPHVHFSNGTSLNQSGTIHDAHRGIPNPTRSQIRWLDRHGWATEVIPR